MTRKPIFQALPQSLLLDISNYLSYDPIIAKEPTTYLRSLPQSRQVNWLHAHRNDLEDEFCSVGSWTFGSTKSYGEIGRGLAGKFKQQYVWRQPQDFVEALVVGSECPKIPLRSSSNGNASRYSARRRRRKMTQEVDERIVELCEVISNEANPGVFVELITELNQLLERVQGPWPVHWRGSKGGLFT